MYNIFELNKPTLKSYLKFELISWYGRHLKKSKNRIEIRNADKSILLDIGFGSNYSDGWINADFFIFPKVKFWRKKKNIINPDLELDLRYPINCPNDVIDGIYSGHVLEHLYPPDALHLLQEIYRILKPNAWFRINIPDLKKFVAFYNNKTGDVEFEQFNTGCEAIGSLTQDYGHISVWDEEFLSHTLSSVGFINIRKVKFGIEGTDKRLIKEETVREWSTLVIEAQKA